MSNFEIFKTISIGGITKVDILPFLKKGDSYGVQLRGVYK